MQPGILSRSTSVPQNVLKKTTGVAHFYCYPETGNDANDGLSESTPKLTLEAIFAVMPERLEHGTWLHLGAGDFDLAGLSFVGLKKDLNASRRLLIAGDNSVVTVAGPWTADIHSTTSIGNSGLSLTPDEHFDYWIEILDGPLAGEKRAIAIHDATTFTPAKNFSGDPGTAQFRIVRPATRITASSGYPTLSISTSGGECVLYNIFIDGSVNFKIENGFKLTFDACIIKCRYFIITDYPHVQFFDFHYLPDDSYEYSYLYPAISPYQGAVTVYGCTVSINIYGIKIGTKGIDIYNSAVSGFVQGAQCLGQFTCINCNTTTGGFKSAAGFAKTQIRNTVGIGLRLHKSVVYVGDMDISGCVSHGVELIDSVLACDGVLAGSGNGGAGVYAHLGSHIRPTAGLPPTVTGTVGDLSVDGTTQVSTWAAVEAGTPVADTTEMVTAKKQ